MRYRYLGNSGLVVSNLTLGTMTFGATGWGCDETEAHRIMAAYIDAGGNMLDAADVYAKGETERIIGTFLPSIKRDNVIVASKCNFPFGDSKNGLGSSRKHMMLSVEASLKRLNTDYLDLFYLHRADPVVPVEEIMETFDILKQQGKILYSACSNLPAWRIMLDNAEAKRRGGNGFVCGQYMYNLVDRSSEQEIIPAMVHQGIGFLCWSPLAGGLLTGKYKGAAEAPKDSRFDYRKSLDGPRFWTEHGLKVANGLADLSIETGIPATKLALGWLLGKQFVSSVIIGVKSLAQLQEILDAGNEELSMEILEALDSVSKPSQNYLWTFNEETNEQFRKRGQLFPGTIIC
jgi:1-deoxyxylulose-5-phosphate synthase